MSRKFYSWFGLLVAVVLLIAANIFSYTTLRTARVDLTEKKLYTLSQGTRNILKNLDEPITLQFYYSSNVVSKSAPGLTGYASTVQELLEEYRDSAGGKIKLEVIDPEPFSEEEDAAALAGLQNVPTQSGETIFLGIAGKNTVDDSKNIPFLDPRKETSLEYDITSIVYDLAHPKKKKLGLLSTLPVLGDADMFASLRQQPAAQPYIVMTQLQQLYEVQQIEKSAVEIPDDVDVLMVVHPKELSDATKYAIDQFVLKGGHALVFVDPHAEADQPPFDQSNPYGALWASRASSLDPLLKSWGVELAENQFVADKDNAQKVNVRNQRGIAQAVDYLAYVQLDQESLNKQDVVTNSLNAVNMGSAGSLKKVEGATTTVTPLLESSSNSMLMEVDKIKFSPQFDEMAKEFKSSGQKHMLAARISGKAKSAYPGGLSESGEAEANPDHLEESPGEINVILVSDVDILADHFWVQVQDFLGQRVGFPMADNGTFVMNAIENLSGSNDLISVRSRGESRREFNRVREIARSAEDRYREREQQLSERVKELEQQINDIQAKRDDKSIMLTAEQEKAIEQAREEFVTARKELRNVQHELNRDIQKLGWRVKFINIAAIPLLISLYAVGLGMFRVVRRKP